MLRSRILWSLLLSASLMMAGAACGDDDETLPEEVPEEDVSEDPDAAEEVALPEDWSFESSYKFRYTKFVLDDDAPGAGMVNPLIEDNIEDQGKKYPVVILMEFKDIDPDTKTLSLRGGAGEKVDLECLPELDGECDYKWDELGIPEYTEGSDFDPATRELNAEMSSLEFITTFPDGDDGVIKSSIPIIDLKLIGEVTPRAYKDENGEVKVAVEINDATLQGYISGEDALDSDIVVNESVKISLYKLLRERDMNVDLSGDGNNDSWYLTGKISAIEANIVE